VLVPLAATGMAVMMVLAAAAHARKGEYGKIAANGLLFILAVLVAWARFGPYAF
jgi:hypothetical protein